MVAFDKKQRPAPEQQGAPDGTCPGGGAGGEVKSHVAIGSSGDSATGPKFDPNYYTTNDLSDSYVPSFSGRELTAKNRYNGGKAPFLNEYKMNEPLVEISGAFLFVSPIVLVLGMFPDLFVPLFGTAMAVFTAAATAFCGYLLVMFIKESDNE